MSFHNRNHKLDEKKVFVKVAGWMGHILCRKKQSDVLYVHIYIVSQSQTLSCMHVGSGFVRLMYMWEFW